MSKILTVDLGTTYFKFALFDRRGNLCHVHRVTPPIRTSPTGAAEIDAIQFANSIGRGIGELHQRNGGTLADVEAVTFATQTNSFVLLDERDEPLTPIILWTDRRAAALEPELVARFEVPGASRTGVPRVNHQFMAAKLLWLQEHAAATWAEVRRLCLISDYFTLLLTGEHVTEAGAAGLTGLLEIEPRHWWVEVLDRLRIPAEWLPAVVSAGSMLGPITAAAAMRFNLPTSCLFAVGCLDQYAGAIGAGNVEPGLISETTGTVLATVQCADRLDKRQRPIVFQGPAFAPRVFYRMAFGSVAGNYLEWYRDQLPNRPAFERLIALAADVEPGAEGLRLRTDVPLSTPEAVFVGLKPHHTPGHCVRSILETVAVALRAQLELVGGDGPPGELRSVGGAARSNVWLQIKADVTGDLVTTIECPEPTSLGAASLAETRLSGGTVVDATRRWVRLQPPHEPDWKKHRIYAGLYPPTG